MENVLTWDFTCVNTLQDTFLFENAKEAGKAAIGGEKRKDVTYDKDFLIDGRRSLIWEVRLGG